MLKVKLFDVDFGESQVVLNADAAREFGLRSQDRIKISGKRGSAVAIVNITTDTFVRKGFLGVFSKVKKDLGLKNGDNVNIELVGIPYTVELIKKKLKGDKLSDSEIQSIITDIVNRNLSSIDLAAFVSALYVRGMDMDETEALTRAMVAAGKTIKFSGEVYDKHSLGGVPGDKTTLLVVPIVASYGLTIPKTSSRAITDPAGTADRMEVFAPVTHDLKNIAKIVNKAGACMVWGGAVDLSPADDMLIHVEYPLSLDPRPLLLASVISKKIAVGSKFIVIDIPTGAGTKVPDSDFAHKLAADFIELGRRLGVTVECAITYGAQPVGNAMGPVLEAIEALKILEGSREPNSVVEKSCAIAGILLEQAGIAKKGNGYQKAATALQNKSALKKFREIVKAQGGKPNVTVGQLEKRLGKFRHVVKSEKEGYITQIKNREIAMVARAAGAPHDKSSGILLHAKGGDETDKGKQLFTIYAEKKEKLEHAKSLLSKLNPVVVEGMLLEEIPASTVIGRR